MLCRGLVLVILLFLLRRVSILEESEVGLKCKGKTGRHVERRGRPEAADAGYSDALGVKEHVPLQEEHYSAVQIVYFRGVYELKLYKVLSTCSLSQ